MPALPRPGHTCIKDRQVRGWWDSTLTPERKAPQVILVSGRRLLPKWAVLFQLLEGEMCLSSPIYLFIPSLFTSLWADGYSFYTLGYKKCTLFCCSNCPRFSHWRLCYLSPAPCDKAPQWALPYFLAPQDAPGSSDTFPAPVLFLQGPLAPFTWRIVVRTQDLA